MRKKKKKKKGWEIKSEQKKCLNPLNQIYFFVSVYLTLYLLKD